MPPTVRGLLRVDRFGLRLLTPHAPLDEPIQWISGTDLADPSPFLADGQMLLTTGTQFAGSDDGDYAAYLDRVLSGGVRALGFGTEVVREGTPEALVRACAEREIPLVEVPYRTPFIALIRWAADLIAGEARARDTWTLAAQRAISLAALGRGGADAALGELAEQLGRGVLLIDADGVPRSTHGSGALVGERVDAIRAESVQLISRARRASRQLRLGDVDAELQTLGSPERMRGVLAVVGSGALDTHERAVVTGVVALAELSLEHDDAAARALRELRCRLLGLVLQGDSETARASATAASVPLPSGAVDVVTVRIGGRSVAGVQDALDGAARALGPRTAHAPLGDAELVILLDPGRREALRAFFDGRALCAGVAEASSLAGASAALERARRAHRRAPRVALAEHRDDEELFGLLDSAEVAILARDRLHPVLADPEGAQLLRCARVWLDHNGAWEPAARELGLHRHSLAARIRRLAELLGWSLDDFGGRARLWAVLTADSPR